MRQSICATFWNAYAGLPKTLGKDACVFSPRTLCKMLLYVICKSWPNQHSDFLTQSRRLNQVLNGEWVISFVSGAARSVTGQKPLQYQIVWSISKGTSS